MGKHDSWEEDLRENEISLRALSNFAFIIASAFHGPTVALKMYTM